MPEKNAISNSCGEEIKETHCDSYKKNVLWSISERVIFQTAQWSSWAFSALRLGTSPGVSTIADIGIWVICPDSIYSTWSHNRKCISELILSGSSFQRSLPNISWKFVKKPAAVLIWNPIPIPMWATTNWWLEQLQPTSKEALRRLLNPVRYVHPSSSRKATWVFLCKLKSRKCHKKEREKEPQKSYQSYHVRFWKFWKLDTSYSEKVPPL